MIRGYAAVLADIDITPAPDPANLHRLADALEELHAAIRVPNEPAISHHHDTRRHRPLRGSQQR